MGIEASFIEGIEGIKEIEDIEGIGGIGGTVGIESERPSGEGMRVVENMPKKPVCMRGEGYEGQYRRYTV